LADYSTQIAKLESALGSGVVTIEADGQRLTYAGAEAIAKAITYFEGKQARQVATPGAAPSNVTLASFSRD